MSEPPRLTPVPSPDDIRDQVERDILDTLRRKIDEAEKHLTALRAEYRTKLDWITEMRAKR